MYALIKKYVFNMRACFNINQSLHLHNYRIIFTERGHKNFQG